MSHYSDHNKRKRLSAAVPDVSDAALGGDGGASPRSTDDQFDDYYRSPASAITQSTGTAGGGGGRFSDAASYHSHQSQRSFASHGSHPSHSHSHRPAGRGQHAPHNYRGFSGGPDVGDGNSTIATINSADLVSLKRDREREGRCSECGAQTHELRVDPRTGARTKEPLNVEGEVRRGRCLYCYPLPSRRSQADNSQASFGGVSHRSIHSHHLIPDAAVSHTSFNSAPVASHRSGGGGGGGGGGQYVSSSRSVSSDHQQHLTQQQHYAMNYHQNSASGSMASLGSLGDMSPRHHPTHGRHRLSDLPDTIESASVASNPSIASTTSAAQLAADQVAIEDGIARFETENADLCDILATMRRFPRSVRVQELGCEKLWIQSWDDENSSAIGRVGGIPTIIDSMRTHAGSAHLQQCGCEALQNLALNDYNREVIAEQGGIIAVIDAMGRHWDVAGVQQCGCTALANIAGGEAGGDNRVAVADCGGLHAILKAVQTFPQDETVLRSAYQALRSLGYNPTQELERAQQLQEQEQSADDDDDDMGEGGGGD